MDNKNNNVNADQVMNNRRRLPRWGRVTVIVSVMCLLIIIAVPGVVLAKIGAINTNDGVWDGNWGTPIRNDELTGPVGYDIDTFWVNTDASNPSTYYFGLTTNGALTTSGPNPAVVYFFVDCNDNNNYTDSVDRVLEYDEAGFGLTEYRGDTWGVFDGPPATNVEKIGTNSLEAQTDNGGSIDWSTCHGGAGSNVNVKAEIWDDLIFNGGATLQDSTTPRPYNLPTAVTLTSFKGGNNSQWISLAALIVISFAGVWVWTVKILAARKKEI